MEEIINKGKNRREISITRNKNKTTIRFVGDKIEEIKNITDEEFKQLQIMLLTL